MTTGERPRRSRSHNFSFSLSTWSWYGAGSRVLARRGRPRLARGRCVEARQALRASNIQRIVPGWMSASGPADRRFPARRKRLTTACDVQLVPFVGGMRTVGGRHGLEDFRPDGRWPLGIRGAPTALRSTITESRLAPSGGSGSSTRAAKVIGYPRRQARSPRCASSPRCGRRDLHKPPCGRGCRAPAGEPPASAVGGEPGGPFVNNLGRRGVEVLADGPRGRGRGVRDAAGRRILLEDSQQAHGVGRTLRGERRRARAPKRATAWSRRARRRARAALRSEHPRTAIG